MFKNISLFIVFILAIACKNTQTVTQNFLDSKPQDISMYPVPQDGFKRVFIHLDQQEDEDDFQIEFYAGKTMKIDCNKHTLMGKFNEQNLSGWGYSYYNFETNGEFRTTLMACPDDEKHQEFVKSTTKIVRYNSKLPIVIYIQDGFEIKYNIWKRQELVLDATESDK